MNDSPWILLEPRLIPKRRRGQDAIFTLGNGYLGCRGFFEEETEGVEALGGVYLAGVLGKGALKAWNGMHRELVNTPNMLRTEIRVDGEPLLARPGRIRSWRRALDMRRGTLTRSFVWRGAQGQRVRVCFERVVSLADRHCVGQRLEITALDGEPHIEVVAAIDARVTNLNLVTSQPLPVQPGRAHLKTLRQADGMIEVQVDTLPHGVRIVEAQTCTIDGAPEATTAAVSTPGLEGLRFQWRAPQRQPVRITKQVQIFTSRDGRRAPWAQAAQARASARSYDELKTRHAAVWARTWHAADIEIDGHDDDQRALRYNLFQLIQGCPKHDSRLSIGARGLTGEMHESSIFWDNEIFKFPFFMFTDPVAAEKLLRFRHHTLPAARRHARDLWFDGAMFAWKSGPDGIEETEMGVGAYYAIHIVADIAYAVHQYWQATGDDRFMARYGVEILIETARFWSSRCYRDPWRGTCNILAVRGPNEYDVIVHNNLYTNMMARGNLDWAAAAVRELRTRAPAAWERLCTRLNLREDEPATWQAVARDLVICHDAERDLYLEDDMYRHRVPFDMARGKPDARRVIDSTLPYEAMALYQITKQSDVICLMNLLPALFTDRQRHVAFDFYLPRTAHDSSLSTSPHAVMAARLGRLDQAYAFFRDCARLDLDDTQLNTISGLHFANFGGTWQSVVFGFAGVSLDGDRLRLDPKLPEPWAALRFRLHLRGGLLRIEIDRTKVRVTMEKADAEPLRIMLGTRLITLDKENPVAEMGRGA